MAQPIRKEHVQPLVGKYVYAVKKDGTVVSGKLVKIRGTQIHIQPSGDKKVHTKAIAPLVLFDLLAIGTSPFGFGFGFPGFGFGGFGFPGFFW